MKKILLPLALLALAMTACDTTPKYTINGTVEGEQEGTVYLMKYNGREADTLAEAPIKAGKFKLEGTTDNIDYAALIVAGKKGGTPIMLENAQFTATLNPADNSTSKVEGTESQKIWNEFMAISNDARKQQSELYKEYNTAKQEKNEEKAKEIENKFDEVGKTTWEKVSGIMKANPDSYVSAFILSTRMSSMDTKELSEMYHALGANAKATEPGKTIGERLAKLEAVAVGKVAPNFTQNTPEGQPLSLYDIKGKVKIIDFWASWCGPCRRANPDMVKLYNKYHKKGLEIIGVSLDRNKEDWEKAIKDDKLDWYQVSDLQYWNNSVAQMYAVNSIPHLFILDENNTIVADNLHGEELAAKVAEMLK